jgi:hypothetical protein
MNKPALFFIIFTLLLMPSESLTQAQALDYDPRISLTVQNQHSFFFNPFSFYDVSSTGTSEAVSWSDASPVLLRSLFPAASADGNRFYVQFNSIPGKTISPVYSYRFFTIITPGYGINPLQIYYSDTFKAVRPNVRVGYFGKPFSGEGRLSAGFTLDVIHTEEPYFGRQHFGYWQPYWQPRTFFGTTLDSFISIQPDMNPLSSNIIHTGLRPELSLSWDLTDRISVGTRLGWAGYRMDGKLTAFRNVVQPNSYTTAGTEHHNRRYRHYDAATGIEFKPTELNRILFTAGFLTGSSDRDIDLTYYYQTSSETSGSSFSSSSTGRNVYYLAAAADHQISRFFTASLLLTWQRGTGDFDEHTLGGYLSGFYSSQAKYFHRITSTEMSTGDIDTREIRAGIMLKFDSSRLSLFSGLWLTDHYEAFKTHYTRSSSSTNIQILEGERTESGSFFESSSGMINRYELIRYEIPAGVSLTVFPWLDMNAAMSYKIWRTGNPNENLYSGQDLPGIGLLALGNNTDPVNYSSVSTEYRTDYYFGLAIRPLSSIHIRAGAQPVYNNLVESSWITNLSVEIVL